MGSRLYSNPVDINGDVIKDLKGFKKLHPKSLVFDSDFERKCYKLLEKAGFNFVFHPESREVAVGFQAWTLSRATSRKLFKATIRNISYTVDFAVYCNDGTVVFIEAKGFFHRDARLRYKLFQASLQKNEIVLLAYDKQDNLKDIKAIIDIINDQFGGSSLVIKSKQDKPPEITSL